MGHLQAFIGRELQACRESLTAAQEAFMSKFLATWDAPLEANRSSHNQNLGTNLGDLEQIARKLEGDHNEMEVRLNNFQTQVISLFELFEECLQGLQQDTGSSELQPAGISRAETAERQNVVQGILQGTGGRPHTLSGCSSAPYLSVAAKDWQTSSPSPECGRQQRSGNSTPCAASLRVEALEVALASMQQQEQERIRRLQEKIRDLQKA